MSMTVMHLGRFSSSSLRSYIIRSIIAQCDFIWFSLRKITNDYRKRRSISYTFMEHMMKGRWDGIRPMHQKELDRTLVVEMTIETASAKIRDVGVVDEPEDYNLNVWAGLVPLKQVAEYPISDEGLPQKMEIPKHVLDYYQQNK